MSPEAVLSHPLLSDEEIIHDVLSGKKASYETIIRRYNPRLFRIGVSILKDEDETESLIQETYLKAYESLNRFQHKSSFGTWLSRIMINESLMYLRRKKWMTYIAETSDGNKKIQPLEFDTPEKIAVNNELRNILEREILQLPLKYRLIFMMREIEHSSVKETSRLLRLSESNVKIRLNRAKALLRTKLKERYDHSDLFSFHLIRCNRIAGFVIEKI